MLPQWQLGDDGLCVWNRVDRDVVALECFDECFDYSVGWLSDGHSMGLGRVLMRPKRISTAGDDKVLNNFALDAFSGGSMGNRPEVTAVERKGHADLLLVVAANFNTIRTPT
jgi:hypothetical protein